MLYKSNELNKICIIYFWQKNGIVLPKTLFLNKKAVYKTTFIYTYSNMKKVALLIGTFVSLSGSAQIIYPGTPTTGTPETVFDYSTDNCNTIDIPDAPARAFRDAAGTLNLIASHYTTWRMTGSSFTTLVRDCTPVMTSDQDTDPATYNNNEWIVAPYTLDGINIHALVHNEYVPCGNANNCWYNSITYVSSSDSGRTYSHTTAPNHLVAASPYESPYPTTHAPFGLFGGSNIIFKDGYYYKMVQLESHLLQDWGAGIIRTNDLSDPTSWRGWNGTDFTVQFLNPYTETGFDPADIVLAPVSRDNIGKMCASLTYNTYFGKYMVVDYTIGEVNGSLQYGFYYALSDDLINWSSKRLIMTTASTWAAGGSNYPSIIDHNDTSRNFEMAGQNCYLYYTKWNSGTYDRDLIRVPVTFNKQNVTSLVVNSTLDTSDKTPGDGLCLTAGNVCTLRAALEEANARPPYDGYDTLALPITFNISGGGLKTISPGAIYPDVFYPVDIDGYTQPGASANTSVFDQGLNTSIKIAIDATHGGSAISFHSCNNVLMGLSFVNGAIDFLYEEGYSKSRNNNTIKGCYIGIEADGATPGTSVLNIHNQHLNTVGGSSSADRNLISGGVVFTKSDSNVVIGNFIGTTFSGMLTSGTSAHGIQIADTCAYNRIGGTAAGERNLISGNNRGIMINGSLSHDNSIIGNFIGVAADGYSVAGNANAGILLGDSTYNNVITDNVISDNSYDEAGIWMDNTYSNIIQSNYIGTDTGMTHSVGNGDPGQFSAGIMLMNGSADNMIGGAETSEGNIIANNYGFGIGLYTNAGNGNSILSNLIYDNAQMGIDLSVDYTPDANDSGDGDSGPNTSLNYPELSGAFATSSSVSIMGTYNSASNSTYTVQYFSTATCDPSGNGQGQQLIGTDTLMTDNSGNVSISSSFNVTVATGNVITAIATDANGNSSEFSECRTVQTGITPTITNTGSLSFCDGDEVTLTSSPGDTYLWSNGETTQSITVDSAASYTVTVDSAGVIGVSAPVVVTVNPLPTLSINGLTTICSGGNTTLTASGADSFVWTNGPSTAAYTVSPTDTTEYFVTGTITATGCSDSISETVNVEICTDVVEDESALREIMVFPNPAQDGSFTINIKNSGTDEIMITVMNTVGMKVFESTDAIGEEYNKQIKLDKLAKGVYYVKVKLDSEIITTKLVTE
jgi:CSLREA domain-containing protein